MGVAIKSAVIYSTVLHMHFASLITDMFEQSRQTAQQHLNLACLDQLVFSLRPCTLLPPPQYAFVLLGIHIHRLFFKHPSWQLNALLCVIRWKLIVSLQEACASQLPGQE